MAKHRITLAWFVETGALLLSSTTHAVDAPNEIKFFVEVDAELPGASDDLRRMFHHELRAREILTSEIENYDDLERALSFTPAGS